MSMRDTIAGLAGLALSLGMLWAIYETAAVIVHHLGS